MAKDQLSKVEDSPSEHAVIFEVGNRNQAE